MARCNALGAASFSDSPDCLYRGYLMPSYVAAQKAIAGWMRAAGMTVRIDGASNLIGRYEGSADGRALLIGSHLDSVHDAGLYDGPLGIMLGIEAVAALQGAGRRLAFPVEVIAFGDEEGSRFPAAMLTSRAVAGTLDPAELDVCDSSGETLGEALAVYNAQKDKILGEGIVCDDHNRRAVFISARRASTTTRAYLEVHIEQGPVLEADGLAVGAVTGIAAQRRYVVTVRGLAGHAGTNTMTLRRDALAGAAEMMLATEHIAKSGSADLVATVGKVEVLPGAANVVPGLVRFTLDVRAGADAERDEGVLAILARFKDIANSRGLTLENRLLQDLPASPCDEVLINVLEAAMAAQGQPARRLVSGAGHDAMIMAAHCPTAMLFIRCAGGISHSPAEDVTPEDADIALRVMLSFIENL